MNHQKVDVSYPKRMWRLSKNITLRYNREYFSFCYELQDTLLDYIYNHHKFSQNNSLNWNPSMPEGSQVELHSFLKRMDNNMVQFNAGIAPGQALVVSEIQEIYKHM